MKGIADLAKSPPKIPIKIKSITAAIATKEILGRASLINKTGSYPKG